ncbi:MAG: formylglycine-generating enzyme family protein [Gemmatimonadota bacterium]
MDQDLRFGGGMGVEGTTETARIGRTTLAKTRLPPLCAATALAVLAGCASLDATEAAGDDPSSPSSGTVGGPILRAGDSYTDTIPGTLVHFEMVAVPGGEVTVEGPEGSRTEEVEPFYIGRTEVSWDMFDVFMFTLDEQGLTPDADALARPSEPYDVPDYGWGRSGYAAISISYHSARAFAEWLSEKTGDRYRLPTEAEWVHAAQLAAGDEPLTEARLDEIAWHAGNSAEQAHPLATREPDALGLHDLFGNAGEWVLSDYRMPVIRGGSFRDPPVEIGPQSWAMQDGRWTERDPQLPRSTWWLTDAPFVGFRLIREP